MGAAAALADTREVVDIGSTIQEASGIYQYAPAVSYRGNWASREVRWMSDASHGSGRNAGLRARFAKSFRTRHFDTGGGAGGDGSGTDAKPEGIAGGPSGPDTLDVGLALPSDVMTPEEYIDLLGEVPEGTFQLADYVVAYTDGTRLLALNLNDIVQSRLALDWESILEGLSIRDGETFAVKKQTPKDAAAKAAAKEELEDSAHAVRKATRSAFRIVIGFSIAVLLWCIVRRL